MQRRFLSRDILNFSIGLMTVFGFSGLLPAQARAAVDPTRDFVVSCSYGVLAGTLVGAATLAFSDRPGDNLNKVARGASLGLYAGILLGAYVVYGVPSDDDDAAAGIALLPRPRAKMPEFQIYPLLSERGFEGASAQWQVLNF